MQIEDGRTLGTIHIEMFPASYGDSFFVSCGDKNKTHLLIDSGFSSTYTEYIRDRLQQLRKSGERLTLLVVTHIDADHLSGALKLLEENGHSSSPHIISIDQIWHNSYKHLQWEKNGNPTELSSREMKILDAIRAQGFPRELKKAENQEEPISAKQGSSMASLILKGDYLWNSIFGGKAVSADNLQLVHLNDDVRITLLTPTFHELKQLEKYWRKELYKLGYKNELIQDGIFDDAFEFLVSREKRSSIFNFQKKISFAKASIEALAQSEFVEDTSVVNGSSISFILHCKDKKILFLGDSHPSSIERQLRTLYDEKPIWFDAVKVSHHGSNGNTSPSLLQWIDSANFFISTNGAIYQHPDMESVARIVSRETKIRRNLIFNYGTPVSAYMDDEERKEKYNYEVQIVPWGQHIEI